MLHPQVRMPTFPFPSVCENRVHLFTWSLLCRLETNSVLSCFCRGSPIKLFKRFSKASAVSVLPWTVSTNQATRALEVPLTQNLIWQQWNQILNQYLTSPSWLHLLLTSCHFLEKLTLRDQWPSSNQTAVWVELRPNQAPPFSLAHQWFTLYRIVLMQIHQKGALKMEIGRELSHLLMNPMGIPSCSRKFPPPPRQQLTAQRVVPPRGLQPRPLKPATTSTNCGRCNGRNMTRMRTALLWISASRRNQQPMVFPTPPNTPRQIFSPVGSNLRSMLKSGEELRMWRSRNQESPASTVRSKPWIPPHRWVLYLLSYISVCFSQSANLDSFPFQKSSSLPVSSVAPPLGSFPLPIVHPAFAHFAGTGVMPPAGMLPTQFNPQFLYPSTSEGAMAQVAPQLMYQQMQAAGTFLIPSIRLYPPSALRPPAPPQSSSTKQ